jgi:hypothetical protein
MWAELSLCKVWAELPLCQVGAGYAGDALVEAALAEGDEGMQQEAMVAAFTAAAAAAAGGEEPGTLVLGLLYCPGAAAGGGAWASVGTGVRAVWLWPAPTSGAGPAADDHHHQVFGLRPRDPGGPSAVTNRGHFTLCTVACSCIHLCTVGVMSTASSLIPPFDQAATCLGCGRAQRRARARGATARGKGLY